MSRPHSPSSPTPLRILPEKFRKESVRSTSDNSSTTPSGGRSDDQIGKGLRPIVSDVSVSSMKTDIASDDAANIISVIALSPKGSREVLRGMLYFACPETRKWHLCEAVLTEHTFLLRDKVRSTNNFTSLSQIRLIRIPPFREYCAFTFEVVLLSDDTKTRVSRMLRATCISDLIEWHMAIEMILQHHGESLRPQVLPCSSALELAL